MNQRRRQAPELVDESTESEIVIQPDGRVFAFGITGPMAAALAALPTSDSRMARLLERIRNLHINARGGETSSAQEIQSCPIP
jgi:hypothetical protein